MKQLIPILINIVLISSCSNKETESKTIASSTTQIDSEETTNAGPWRILGVKDEFGDKIDGRSTITADFKGKMSNSAISDEELTVRMQVEDSTLLTAFYEYNREPQAKLPENKFVNVKIKLANGEVKTIKQFLFKDLMVDGDKKELLQLMIKEKNPFKVIVDLTSVSEYESTIYSFEIDPTGFNNIITKK